MSDAAPPLANFSILEGVSLSPPTYLIATPGPILEKNSSSKGCTIEGSLACNLFINCPKYAPSATLAVPELCIQAVRGPPTSPESSLTCTRDLLSSLVIELFKLNCPFSLANNGLSLSLLAAIHETTLFLLSS